MLRHPAFARSVRALLVSLPLLLVSGSCATNPATGRPQLSFFGEEAEMNMGKNADSELVSTVGVYDDDGWAEYVDEVGHRLAAASERPYLPWSFKVLDDPTVNAFALPGGYVYVTRGLLAVTTSEDELAGVLAHEIGHVAARHAVQRVSRAAPLGVLTGLGAATAGLVSPTLGAAVGGFGAAANEMLLAPYGRDQEREADRVGAEMSAKAGFDPTALAEALRALEREEAITRKGR
ncbi:MAG TPA: M48 family metalloprotease [Thermoanaerobaculia bacterium]|nr:M48 family metalloprotease [Thermoanaerobaculia bacterium]